MLIHFVKRLPIKNTDNAGYLGTNGASYRFLTLGNVNRQAAAGVSLYLVFMSLPVSHMVLITLSSDTLCSPVPRRPGARR